MKQIYNTSDHLYSDKDVINAFTHAYFLGKADNDYNIKKAFDAWKKEYSSVMKELTLDAVMDVVSEMLVVTVYGIKSKHRQTILVKARNLISWFAYMYTELSLYDIRDYMGYKDHASVLHGFDTVNNDIKLYKQDRDYVEMIKIKLLLNGYALTRSIRSVFTPEEHDDILQGNVLEKENIEIC